MASADDGSSSGITDTASDSDDTSDQEAVRSKSDHQQEKACRYYNSGYCRDGKNCRFLHYCKYALKGTCTKGTNCEFTHPQGRKAVLGGNQKTERKHTSGAATTLTDGRFYQWQLKYKNDWKDVINDHIIEAQFSLPHIRGIKLYNTPYGVVNIDFKKMRVYGKRLKVRRLDDGKTTWLWYCNIGHKWVKYDGKDSKGNPIPAKSSDIEQKFQANPMGSFIFIIGTDTLEIQYNAMQQVSTRKKRKVTRRPMYRQPQARATAAGGISPPNHFIYSQAQTPQWQYKGNHGKWRVFKKTGVCSTSSDDIEKEYQQNPSGSMIFTIQGQTYKLDFGTMTQMNLSTTHSREVRRVLS
ncbi:protein mono-ADP-ribosyltransferase PARP12 isoform X2 [Thalassophryne amazonica]|uniref:protein mono-ADP-ribosyltransferase PARP12 isoform X2 n=1 Tax=Thalassophryne amazonica TaxID=390379 RepID=UPI0014716203|nr:protein mono-ADP-ribosyltransferase PARP12 isoform X2 [Thalassophryne amazonica]